MPQYANIDPKIAGLKQGLDSRVESKIVAELLGIDFGLPVFGNEGVDDLIYLYHNDRSQLAFDADFVTANSIVITVNGTAVTAVPFNTDHDTTMNDVIAQIEADITGSSVALDATDGTNRTIFIDINGVEVIVTEAITGGGSQATGTATISSRQVFKGYSLFTQKESAEKTDLDGNVIDAADAKYLLKDAANVLIDGWVTVTMFEAVNSGVAAYVKVAAGATQGQTGTTTSGNTALTGVTIDETIAAAGLARVRVNK